MKPEVSSVTVDLAGGKQLSFETGKLAKQAGGSAVVRMGDNVVLAAATANPDPREGIDFFPLTVDYREYTYAGGRIPGGFIKREGRMSEREVLTSRQIDRPVRPMFAEGFKCETQVIAFVLSADNENDPDVLGINAASAALTLSHITFTRPTRTAPIGPRNGMSERVSAAEAAVLPRTAGSFALSAESTKAMTCVSHLKPSANMGRTGRSIWRLVRTSRSLMRPSRLMNPPGMRPPA